MTNTAQAHANGTNSNTDTKTVTATQSPALTKAAVLPMPSGMLVTVPQATFLPGTQRVTVINRGAYVTWKLNGTTYQAYSGPTINGMGIFMPVIFRASAFGG